MITYISDTAHYKEVLTRIPQVKHSLWIGTADIKDLYMDLPAGRLGVRGDKKVPLLGVLAKLIQRGVEVRLIHAKEPGPNFREDFDKYPVLFSGLERVLCPRVHLKMIIMDGELAYVGSANLTGAGIGLKSDGKRNFETGFLTDEPGFIDAAMTQFDNVWIGHHCKSCRRKDFCGDPIK